MLKVDRSKERRESVDILENTIDLFDLAFAVDCSDEH